ncbi:MAG: DUF1015 domain-containing protein [Phycisphaerae bacterium]|nr:DUF1015 domain-containing protein [Phycisphaerae bacterium]
MKIRPFRGWRFPEGDISAKIAPPYDILDQNDKDNLLARSEHNIVAIDLPHVPPKDLGPEEKYLASAALLQQWQQSGALVQDDKPALYAYEQSYTWAGQTYTRRAMLAGVRATPLGEDVIPHEHTFAGPKEDRLKLTTVTNTQMSPIFGFYNDPAGAYDKLRTAANSEPDLSGEMDGVTEKLWIVTNEKVIAEIAADLASVPVYIADGHHRYTTAMNYAKSLRDAGEIDQQHETNFVMFALVAGDDKGLLVLPTHRVVRGLVEDFSLEKLRQAMPSFDWQKVETPDVDLADADAFLRPLGEGTMAIVTAGEMWTARLTDPQAMVEAAPDQCDAWRALDVAVLHELILDKALAAFKTDDFGIEYTPDGNIARDMVKSGDAQVAFCLQGTPLQAVIDVADAAASMPHKSTYFYPKLATGMVLKPLK